MALSMAEAIGQEPMAFIKMFCEIMSGCSFASEQLFSRAAGHVLLAKLTRSGCMALKTLAA